MNIHILSDLHLEFSDFVPPLVSADVVVLAGDIGVGTEGLIWANDMFDVPVIYVPGNHEYHNPDYSMLELIGEMQEVAQPHVHLLDNNSCIVGGVRFIGSTLWTDLKDAPSALYCDIDRIIVDEANQITRRLSHFSTNYAQSLFEENMRWLKAELAKPFDGKTVVVTHHAPSKGSLHEQYADNPWNPCFINNIEQLMGDSVDVWVHGHTHNNFDYKVNGTRVMCNPRGYPNPFGGWENAMFNAALTINI